MTLVMKEVLLQGKIKYCVPTYFGAKCIFNYVLYIFSNVRYKRSANFGKSIQTNCPIGTVKNPNALWCYRVTNFSDIDQCSDDVFEPLLFYTEMEVKGFMELLKTHSLNITTQGMYFYSKCFICFCLVLLKSLIRG